MYTKVAEVHGSMDPYVYYICPRAFLWTVFCMSNRFVMLYERYSNKGFRFKKNNFLPFKVPTKCSLELNFVLNTVFLMSRDLEQYYKFSPILQPLDHVASYCHHLHHLHHQYSIYSLIICIVSWKKVLCKWAFLNKRENITAFNLKPFRCTCK